MNQKIYNKLKEIWPCSDEMLSSTFGVDIVQDGMEIDQLTYHIDDEILHKYFSEIWQPKLKKFKFSGLKLIDEVNALDPRAVLDVGCGYNEFKGKIKNLIGLDPYNAQADLQIKIEDYSTDQKFDVILCLGSINFGTHDKIMRELQVCKNLLADDGKMFFRVNPGLEHEAPESKYINFYPWNVYTITEIAKQLNLSVLDLRHDFNDRIYFVLAKF
jgi:hypothetical protein